jgi:hypothetical protein
MFGMFGMVNFKWGCVAQKNSREKLPAVFLNCVAGLGPAHTPEGVGVVFPRGGVGRSV